MAEHKSVLEIWTELTLSSREGNEMSMMHGIVERLDGAVTVMAFMQDVSPDEVWDVMHKQIGDFDVKSVIWGTDRFTKPEQGIDKKSVITIYLWNKDHLSNYGFKFGVLPYDETGFGPITWDHPFWNKIQKHEVDREYDQARAQNELDLKNAGLPPELCDKLADKIREMYPYHPTQVEVQALFNELATAARRERASSPNGTRH